jgi:hypothetical protein
MCERRFGGVAAEYNAVAVSATLVPSAGWIDHARADDFTVGADHEPNALPAGPYRLGD